MDGLLCSTSANSSCGVLVEIENEGGSRARQTSREIEDINLAYLLLAQKLVKQDRALAMSRLGIREALADMLGKMSTAQIARMAASNLLLCSFSLAGPAARGADETGLTGDIVSPWRPSQNAAFA